MQYLLLIYEDESVWAALPAAERERHVAEYQAVHDELAARGCLRGSNPLGPVSSATSLRVRDGRSVLSVGPFAETPEQLGGYYHVELEDLDEAIAIAERLPAARTGTIEIRPAGHQA